MNRAMNRDLVNVVFDTTGMPITDLAGRTGIAIERLRAIEAGRIDGTAQERRRIAAAMITKEMATS